MSTAEKTPMDATDATTFEEDTEITGTHTLETATTEPVVTPPPVDSASSPTTAPTSKREPSYMRQDTQQEIDQRWQQVQGEFVDDPRKSVAHAHQLVSDAVQRIVDTFTSERNELERQWSEGQDVSTEDLRVCLHRYREFFTRLLPLQATK
jgi:hypothetical protein